MSRNLVRLLEIMTMLRHPTKGCVWDCEQTFATIAPHTVEEAYEVAEAIDQNDMESLRDELGDLLFQVVFHAQMASELGHFDFDAVAESICEKMIRRHPHVFGDMQIGDAESQTRNWEAHKAEERRKKAKANGDGEPSALDGLTRGLPALTRAMKLQNRAARVGFDWDSPIQVLDKIAEETEEVRAEIVDDGSSERVKDEVGDLLFAVVNLARKLKVDPETALRHANGKFETRFRAVEHGLAAEGKRPETSTLDEMEAHWTAAKARLAAPGA